MKYKTQFLAFLQEERLPDWTDDEWENYVNALCAEGAYDDFEESWENIKTLGLSEEDSVKMLQLIEKAVVNEHLKNKKGHEI